MWEAGHIESATHFLLNNIQNADTTIKTPDEIQKAIAQSSIDTSKKIVTNCNTGMMASLLFSALTSAGLTNLAVYDGSWTEYVRIISLYPDLSIECKKETTAVIVKISQPVEFEGI